jgi:ferredoxin--NADP+ reductase
MSSLKENLKTPDLLEEVTITAHQEIAAGVYLIAWKRTHDFEPGMVVKLTIDKNEIVPRIYSICSGNHEAEIRVLFNVKEDGLLTPILSKVNVGNKIWVSRPYGSFLDNQKPAWWIATGTGIAPFYSMFRSGIFENRTLIHGVRSLDQFYFENEFQQTMPDRYIRCCAHEINSNVFPGRVTNYLQQLDFLPSDIYYYLCGKAIMVVEVRDILIARGVPYEHILSEIYF